MATLVHHTQYLLPKTLNISAGYDPLRDEDIRYHELMQEAGFDSELMHFPDMVHAFINMENLCLEQCAKMYGRIGEFAKA